MNERITDRLIEIRARKLDFQCKLQLERLMEFRQCTCQPQQQKKHYIPST